MDKKKVSNNKLIGAGIFTAIAASLCCITPVLAVLGGLSGAASAFSWLDPFRPFLIAITILVLSFAWYQKLKPQTPEEIACACEDDKKPSFWQSKKFLGIVTIFALIMLAFPYYSSLFFHENQTKYVVINEQNLIEAKLQIEGMTCTACEHSINHALKNRQGVIQATSSYKTGIANVKFDKSRVSMDELINAIEKEVGYKVVSHKVIKGE